METVLVIFGGRSAEHDVSIVTAIGSVIKPLTLAGKYKVEALYVAKDGSWHWSENLKDISLFTSGKIDDFLRKDTPVSVRFDGGLTLVKSTGIANRAKSAVIDIAFPAMHGTYGEDGALMGLLDMAGVPYVGCGLAASAIAMDKILAKEIAAQNDIPVTPFATATRKDVQAALDELVSRIESDLTYPLFVKPAHLGSSIGITRAATKEELRNGLEVAAHYDDKTIIEEAVQNLIEVTLPIMGNEQPRPALLEQPLLKADDFFDFETKYMQGGKKGKGKAGAKQGAQGYSKLPADLPEDLYKKAESIGLATYRALGCSGIARVDMLIDSKTQEVFFNEVNPLPGSLYTHNWRAAGVSGVDLVESLIGFAKDRHASRIALATTFNTSYLTQF